jgi:O-antigen/teichoic acid export membrane protein
LSRALSGRKLIRRLRPLFRGSAAKRRPPFDLAEDPDVRSDSADSRANTSITAQKLEPPRPTGPIVTNIGGHTDHCGETEAGNDHGEGAIVRVLRDITRYLPAAVIPYLVAPVTTAVFTRTFLPASYGVYALAIAIAAPTADALTTWIIQPTARYYAEYHLTDRTNLYEEAVSTATAALTTLAAMVGGAILAGAWAAGWLGDYGALWAGALAFMVTRIPWAIGLQILRSSLQPNKYLAAALSNAFLLAAIPLFLVLEVSRDIAWLAWGLAAAQVFVLPYVLWGAGLSPGAVNIRLDETLVRVLKRFAAYGIPMSVWWLGSTFLSVEDRYVIAAFRGAAEVATYSVNYQLVNGLTSLLNGPILLGFGPVLYSYWSRGLRDEVERAIAQMTSLYTLLIFCFLGGVVVVGPAAAALVIGPHFRVGVAVLLPLAVGMAFYGVALLGHSTLVLGEGTRAMATSAVVAAGLNLILNLALVPFYGYAAAAYSTAVAYAVYAGFIWWQSKRFVRWRVDQRTVLSGLLITVAATAAAIGAGSFWSPSRDLEYIFRGAIYLLVFMTLATLVEGRRQLRSLFPPAQPT